MKEEVVELKLEIEKLKKENRLMDEALIDLASMPSIFGELVARLIKDIKKELDVEEGNKE